MQLVIEATGITVKRIRTLGILHLSPLTGFSCLAVFTRNLDPITRCPDQICFRLALALNGSISTVLVIVQAARIAQVGAFHVATPEWRFGGAAIDTGLVWRDLGILYWAVEVVFYGLD